jgi:hypothetical protein
MSRAIDNNTTRPFDDKNIPLGFNQYNRNPISNEIIVAEDCSGFLLVIANNSTLNTIDFNQVINPAITLEITDSSGTTTTYTDGTDYDIDYYAGELIHGVWIDLALKSGEYTVTYKITGDNIKDVKVVYCFDASCCECDPDYKAKFLKAYALTIAVELAPPTANSNFVNRAIKLRDNIVTNIGNCKSC